MPNPTLNYEALMIGWFHLSLILLLAVVGNQNQKRKDE